MPSRVVIAGGAGFLGSHLSERFLAEGFDVVCLDNLITGRLQNIEHLGGRPGFDFRRTDVAEPFDVDGPVDFVLHFASPASPVDYLSYPIETLRAGSLATLNLLELARAKRARFLMASTSETYGDPHIHPQPETYWGNVNPVGPRAVYDEAKRFSEAATVAYRTHHGVDTGVLRIFNTYGPRMRRDDGRALPTFVHQALEGLPLTVAGDGSQTRSLCFVDDLVDGILLLLRSGHPGPMNVGNPAELTMLELARTVRAAAGSQSELVFVPRPQDDPELRRPDISLAREVLGWTPRTDLATGLSRTIEWFRSTRETPPGNGGTPVGAAFRGLPSPRTPSEESSARVGVVGLGYVGAVTAACLATLGHEVCGVDLDEGRVRELAAGRVPFHEPGLADQVRSALGSGRLTFDTDLAGVASTADVVFLCVGTPPASDGSADLTHLEDAVRAVAPYLRAGAVVVNKSTVPVGSGQRVADLLHQVRAEDAPGVHVVSNPEFLREGAALEDFLHPDRIVLGGEPKAVDTLRALYAAVLEQDFPGGRPGRRPELLRTDFATAEMVKYASNAFLAMKVSFANEIANISTRVGADARVVLPAVGADRRIGRAFLGPGIGWGGSCFGKDLAALTTTAKDRGYAPSLLEAVVAVNRRQRTAVVDLLESELGNLAGVHVGILGLAFKPGTDDLRDAPALDIAARLLDAGVIVRAYDPVVRHLPAGLSDVRIAQDAYQAAAGCDALVLATEWPEFRRLDLVRIAASMEGDVLVDGRDLLDARTVEASGLRLFGAGTWRSDLRLGPSDDGLGSSPGSTVDRSGRGAAEGDAEPAGSDVVDLRRRILDASGVVS